MTTDLNLIAAVLEGLEETIIGRLIDRAQFRANMVVYRPGASGFQGEESLSLLGVRMRFHEEMDSQFGRFHVPEERPFRRDLPPSRRGVNLSAGPLALDDYNAVNLTGELRNAYLDLVPRLCRPGDDGQYGSAVEHDVYDPRSATQTYEQWLQRAH